MKKFSKDNAVSVITIGVVLVVLFVLMKFIKKLSDPFGTNEEEIDLDDTIKYDNNNLTYPLYWYESSANSIENALLGDLVEDEQTVDNIMWQIHNDDDIAKLVESFGVRQMTYFGSIPSNNFNLISAIQTYTPERIQDYNNHFEGWKMNFRF